MHTVQTSQVTIGGQVKHLTSVTLNQNAISLDDVFKGMYHEINLIDRSGSIGSQINAVVDALIVRAEAVRKINGYFTVAWFSGPGQYSIVLKAAKVDDNIIKLLNNLRSTIGTTCFSEVLGAVVDTLDELRGLADITIVNLMTDGQPVVRDVHAEIQLSLGFAQTIGGMIGTINTIGIGSYYNRQFLVDLASKSKYGRMVHLDNLKDQIFEFILSDFHTEAENVLNTTVQLTFKSGTTTVEGVVVYANEKVNILKLDQSGIAYDGMTPDGKQSFIAITEQAVDVVGVAIDGKIEECTSVKGVTDVDKETALYAYAYYAFNTMNNRKLAYDIIRSNLKDKHAATQLSQAFTHSELGSVSELLYDCAVSEVHRFIDGKCGPSFQPTSAFTSVLDVLSKIAEDEKCLFIPYNDLEINEEVTKLRNKHISEYARTTRKVTDVQDAFKSKGSTTSPVDLVFAEDRLNVSARFKIEGVVELNANAAARTGLDVFHECHKFRTHTFIKDGVLNVQVAEFMVTDGIADYLQEVNKKYRGFVKHCILGSNEDGTLNYFMLDFKRIPFIKSTSLEEVSVDTLIQKTLAINNLEVTQKAIKYLIEDQEALTSGTTKTGTFKKLTVDQIQVLKDHGITSANVYQGIANVAPTVDALDSYETREVYTYVKGFSAIPSRTAVQKKVMANKAMTASESALHNALLNLELNLEGMKPRAAIAELNYQLADVRKQLLQLRNELSQMKITTVLNNAWFNSITLDENDSADLGNDVILKAKRVVEYV